MNRQRLFHGLRIAWTAGCGILCLLMIVLWWRSYQLQEAAYGTVSPTRALAVVSEHGALRSYTFPKQRLSLVPLYGTVSRCHECCHDGAELPVLGYDPLRGIESSMPHWLIVITIGG